MPKANRVPRILYFHNGVTPTDDHYKDAERFGPNVGFRNAEQVSQLAMSPLEECDAVAGDVPKRYADAYPNVSGFSGGDRLLRMSDLDRRHGPVGHIDNEAARGAKPPAVSADQIVTQGATRPNGAMTMAGGGFVAPTPGNPDNLLNFGSERAENGPEGRNTEGEVSRFNPHGLTDAGATLPRTGTDPDTITGVKATGGGVDGFQAPELPDDADEAAAPKRSRKGASNGDSGDTGAAS